ncbi:ISNCY family transposase ISAtsp9 [subsurface metagenome]
MVAPGKRQVIPLGPEFISNKSIGGVQDCELEAGKRLIPKLRSAHRQLSMVIVGDSLYSKQPFIKVLKEQRMHFILGAKPKDHKSLMEDIEGLRRGGYLSRLEYTDKKKKRYVCEWVNDIPLNGYLSGEVVNYIEFHIYNATEGKRTYHNSWVTDLEVNEVNVRDLVKGGRARWKIENEGFNTLKNHGYHLEHNFGHGTKNLSEAFFVRILNISVVLPFVITQKMNKS